MFKTSLITLAIVGAFLVGAIFAIRTRPAVVANMPAPSTNPVVLTDAPTYSPQPPSVSPYPSGLPFAYPAGLMGYAISWAQCGGKYPDMPYDFGIMDVNGGRSMTHNPCLASEFAWASKAKYPPTFYVNLTYPPIEYRQGIATPRDYGYGSARDAYDYANSQGASSPMWWLDVQIKSTWSDGKSINAQVVQGAIDFFNEKHLSTGLSTTSYQWSSVVGAMRTGLPNWVPGIAFSDDQPNAQSYCLNAKSYSSGYVQQLADIRPQFETVYTCGGK